MNTKIFSYKVEGIVLKAVSDNLKVSPDFDRKKVIEEIKTILAADNFKPDEASLTFRIKDEQLFIEGLAVQNEAPKSIGFMSSK